MTGQNKGLSIGTVTLSNGTELTKMPEACYFKAWRDESPSSDGDKYQLDMEWWEVFACKLAFVLCFEVRRTDKI